jgi:hypothetical protein
MGSEFRGQGAIGEALHQVEAVIRPAAALQLLQSVPAFSTITHCG